MLQSIINPMESSSCCLFVVLDHYDDRRHLHLLTMATEVLKVTESSQSYDSVSGTTNDTIVGLMDFTLLDHNATDNEIQTFCDKANIVQPAAVCVFAEHVALAKSMLNDNIPVAAVCGGFPSADLNVISVTESIEVALTSGADEIDIVLEPREDGSPPGKDEEEYLTVVRKVCHSKILKVIIETPLLSPEIIRKTSLLALSSGADFIKSCTGKRGSCSVEDAVIMSQCLQAFEESTGEKRGVKVSGGVQTRAQAMALLSAIIAQHSSLMHAGDGTISRYDSDRIRIGASSLLKNLMPQVYVDQPLGDLTSETSY